MAGLPISLEPIEALGRSGAKARSTVRDEIGLWNFSVQSRKNASVCIRKLYQVAVRRLLWSLNPGWKMRDIVINPG
jgi:hypothetical protein